MFGWNVVLSKRANVVRVEDYCSWLFSTWECKIMKNKSNQTLQWNDKIFLMKQWLFSDVEWDRGFLWTFSFTHELGSLFSFCFFQLLLILWRISCCILTWAHSHRLSGEFSRGLAVRRKSGASHLNLFHSHIQPLLIISWLSRVQWMSEDS